MNQTVAKILAIVFLLILPACSEKPVAIAHAQEQFPKKRNIVFVDSHGWHTGFIVPGNEIEGDLPFLKERFHTPLYYEFGWGDKGFYQSEKISIGLTFRAMFWSSGSVMHVVAVPESPFSYFPGSQVVALSLSDSELNDLRTYIKNSFAYDKKGSVIKLQQGRYGDSQFYEGNGTYYLFNTCNKWTAKGLKSTGMDISTPFKLSAGSIMDYLESNKEESLKNLQKPLGDPK
jgi:uncharacterized protein (TIGR02117 family)